MNWKNYFFTADFTDVRDYLSSKEEGYLFHGSEADVLSQILTDHDTRRASDDWNAHNRECNYNVVGAKVVYNGENSQRYRSNAKYSHILVLEFPVNNFCPQGQITLQYNQE